VEHWDTQRSDVEVEAEGTVTKESAEDCVDADTAFLFSVNMVNVQ
jgi:hypothetical protein